MQMVFPPPLTALVVSLSAWLGAAFSAPHERPPIVQQMVVRDEIIIHVPIAQHRLPPFEWVEHKGPKCLPAAMIAGAALATTSSVDFVLRDRSRVRARLDNDCAGLDLRRLLCRAAQWRGVRQARGNPVPRRLELPDRAIQGARAQV
jgi:hypothetical protein